MVQTCVVSRCKKESYPGCGLSFHSRSIVLASDVEKILRSVGIEADAEKLKKVIAELNGKDVGELIAAGREKLSSMPAGGAAPAAAAAAGAAPAASAAAEEKKEEGKKEESESEDEDMGFGLFD